MASIRLLTSDHPIHYFAHVQSETHSGYVIEYVWGGKWWSYQQLFFLNTQYPDLNIGIKVFYDHIVTICIQNK